MTIEQLEAEERRLWAELKAMEEPVDRKRREWSDCAMRLQKAMLTEKLREELRAELAQPGTKYEQ